MKATLNPLVRVLRSGAPILAWGGALAPLAALAGPSGESGMVNATVSRPDLNTTVIDQSGSSAIVNWQEFSVGGSEYVQFNQPNASAAILNRVVGGNASEILGNISANGRVFLINSAGVMFGAGSTVNVGSLMVSTQNISDNDFIAGGSTGHYFFSGNSIVDGNGAPLPDTPTTSISNAGTLTATDGFIVLGANQVSNAVGGVITASGGGANGVSPGGDVALVSGSAFELTLLGNEFVSFEVLSAASSDGVAAGVSNLGEIVANRGSVLLTADIARALAGTAVNNGGTIRAMGIEETADGIYLTATGNDVYNSGTLAAAGGTIHVESDTAVTLASGASVTGGDITLRAQNGQIIADSALSAENDLDIFAGQGVDLRATLTAGNRLQVHANSGAVKTAALDGRQIWLSASDGDITIGSSGSPVQVRAGDQLDIFTSAGGVTVDGDIQSQGTVSVYASGREVVGSNPGETYQYGIDINGDITATRAVSVMLEDGDIQLRNITVNQGEGATDTVSIDLGATAGRVDVVGNLSATANDTLALIDVSGHDGIQVSGDVHARGMATDIGGYATGLFVPSYDFEHAGASISLNAYAGDLVVDGRVSAVALAGTFTGTGPVSEGAVSQNLTWGSAHIQAYARNIALGELAAEGVGLAMVTLDALNDEVVDGVLVSTAGDVRIAGSTTITASAGIDEIEYEDGSSSRSRSGSASLMLFGKDVETGAIDIVGPNAALGLSGEHLQLNGDVRVATQTGDQSSLLEHWDADGALVADSSFAYAIAQLIGRGGSETDPSISASGDIGVSGPYGLLYLASAYGVQLDGDVRVDGTGFSNHGTGSLLPYEFAAGVDDFLVPLQLESGDVDWGTAGLIIGGLPTQGGGALDYFDQSLAGDVTIGGDLAVHGQGTASADIYASSLDVRGANGIRVVATAGTASGIADQSIQTINGTDYQVTEMVGGSHDGDQVTGLLRYGNARFDFNSGDARGDFSASKVRIEGPSANFSIGNAARVSIDGDLEVLGGRGADTPTLALTRSYTPVNGGPALASEQLYLVGDHSRAAIGYRQTERPDAISIGGNVRVEGTGLASLVLQAGTVDVTGNIAVTADMGTWTNNFAIVPDAGTGSNDWLTVAPTEPGFGDAAVLISTGSTTAAGIGGLDVVAADAIHLGLHIAASGDVSIRAGGAIDTVLPVFHADFSHPAENSDDPPSSEVALTPLSIAAQNIALTFGSDTTLNQSGSRLDALGTLTIDGGGTRLSGELANWSGANIVLQQLVMTFGSLTLDTGSDGDLSILDSTLHYDQGQFSGRTITVSQSNLFGRTHSFTAGSRIALDGSTLSAAESRSESVTLTAPLIEVLNDSSIRSDSVTLDGDVVNIDGSHFDYNSGTFIGDLITLHQSALLGHSHSFTASQGIEIDDSSVSGNDVAAETISLSAPMIDVLGGADLDADDLNLDGTDITLTGATLSGQSIDISGETVTLSGTITGGHVTLDAGGVLGTGDDPLQLNAAALDATARRIALNNSTLVIGSGLASNGQDPGLAANAKLPANLRPASTGPNAAFIGEEGVDIGNLSLQGGYLFVKAPTVSVVSISTPGALFYNYRPFDDGGHISVLPNAELPISAQGITFAFGGSDYSGNIQVLGTQPPLAGVTAKATDSANYVFMTDGQVNDLNQIGTTGTVLVLNGIVATPIDEMDVIEETTAAQTLASTLAPGGHEPVEPPAPFEEYFDGVIAGGDEFECK